MAVETGNSFLNQLGINTLRNINMALSIMSYFRISWLFLYTKPYLTILAKIFHGAVNMKLKKKKYNTNV